MLFTSLLVVLENYQLEALWVFIVRTKVFTLLLLVMTLFGSTTSLISFSVAVVSIFCSLCCGTSQLCSCLKTFIRTALTLFSSKLFFSALATVFFFLWV